MKKIVLASTSKRRKQLLEQIGVKFDVIGSDYEEKINKNLKLTSEEQAKKFALGKVKSVEKKILNNNLGLNNIEKIEKKVMKKTHDYLIIGADTFAVCQNKILGKPGTQEKAKKYLHLINGKQIYAITGLAVLDTKSKKVITKAQKTKVFIKEMTQKEIQDYVNTKEPIDKGGAFAIQGIGALIVEKIEGDYNNIVGLPLFTLAKILRECGYDVLQNNMCYNKN